MADSKEPLLDENPKPNDGKWIFESPKFKAKGDGQQLAKKDHMDCPSSSSVLMAEELLDTTNSQPWTENLDQYFHLQLHNLEWDSLIHATFVFAKSNMVERKNLWAGLASFLPRFLVPGLLKEISMVRDDGQLYTLVLVLAPWNIWKCKILKPIIPQTVLWESLSLGYLKLNADGSSLGNPRVDGGGGIVHMALGLP
ncbi:hypothetical protein ACH5RR_009022 [Cinchona calisaya]|uniref:Uncharacterized protein n=1 Tax=Cinchona calisaya TaxID=153742 RepID=A0ABD3ACZ7_9GENT